MPQTGTPPKKAGACPLSNHTTESDFPTARQPMGVEMATESDFPTACRPMGVEMATERFSHDAPSNEGGERLRRRFAHPRGKRNIRNARLGSGGGKRVEVVEVVVVEEGRGRRRGGYQHRVAGSSPAELDHRRL